MNKQILLMLELQKQLNDATNGLEWTKGVTKNGKVINWRRCIYMECAEMVDSFPWKHWKAISAEPDWHNHQIEVVDVWHFIMSLAIEVSVQEGRDSLEELSREIATSNSFDKIERDITEFGEIEDVLETIETLMRIALSKERLDFGEIFSQFFELVAMSGLNLETLYRLYVGKNILNQFRQDYGYKEGTYIKVWNLKEDNVVMKEIWEQESSLTPELLYKKLAIAYEKVS